jgi:hypothetical protein
MFKSTGFGSLIDAFNNPLRHKEKQDIPLLAGVLVNQASLVWE